MPIFRWAAVVAIVINTASLSGCGSGMSADAGSQIEPASNQRPAIAETASDRSDRATSELVLAGGCFWCMEAAFEQLRGVTDVVSGYAGGTEETADYRTVSAGQSQHAESVRIHYDPQVINEETLLRVFFTAAHDPTQLNRQYPDVGRQYRSAVFVEGDEQKQRVERMIAELDASGQFDKSIATTLEPLDGFYPAEEYHQDYARLNPEDPYVLAHSLPRAAKVREVFPELVREENVSRTAR